MTDEGRDAMPMIDPVERTAARLLRLAGPRSVVSPDRTARVLAGVQAAFRQSARQRLRRRRGTQLALAVAAGIWIVVWFGWPRAIPAPEQPSVVATIDRSQAGTLNSGGAVHIGEVVATRESERARLTLQSGSSLRMDVETRLRFTGPQRVSLEAGRVYIDSGAGGAKGIDVVTTLGVVHDIGTQYEVMVVGSDTLRIRVRSGLVELRRGIGTVAVRPGHEARVGSSTIGIVEIQTYGDSWAWAAALAPEFDIDGRPLSAFLEHVCREQGWTLGYAEPALARDASGIILRGSVAGLSVEDALSVVLATSSLTSRLVEGELEVTRQQRQ